MNGRDVYLAVVAAGPDLRGPSWPLLAAVVGDAVATWISDPLSFQLVGVTSGTAGAGVVSGTLYVVPNPLPVTLALSSAGVLGLDAPSVGSAIGIGVATAVSTSAAYVGASAGVGAGTDVSAVSRASGATLTAYLAASAQASGLSGAVLPLLFSGLGPGIAALLSTASGTGVVTGPPSPSAAVGSSLSQVT